MYSRDLIYSLLQTLLLSSVSRKRKYAYEIIRELNECFGKKDLNDGWVNTILKRLESEKLIVSEVMIIAGIKRRYFEITESGREILEHRSTETADFIKAVSYFLSLDVSQSVNYVQEYNYCLN